MMNEEEAVITETSETMVHDIEIGGGGGSVGKIDDTTHDDIDANKKHEMEEAEKNTTTKPPKF